MHNTGGKRGGSEKEGTIADKKNNCFTMSSFRKNVEKREKDAVSPRRTEGKGGRSGVEIRYIDRNCCWEKNRTKFEKEQSKDGLKKFVPRKEKGGDMEGKFQKHRMRPSLKESPTMLKDRTQTIYGRGRKRS